MSYAIENGTIYTDDKVIKLGYVIIESGKIKAVEKGRYKGKLKTIDVEGMHVLPGFIDLHIHGGYGEDVMDASFEGLQNLSEKLLSEGTTSYLATTMTQSNSSIEKAIENVVKIQSNQEGEKSADILGIHLEGPFISENKIGAQNPKYIQRPSFDKLKHFQSIAKSQIKIVTIAPEVKGALDTIQEFKESVIFSMGHSEVTFNEANQAIDKGVRHVTHLYNAGTSFMHRNPGMFGAAWTNPNVKTEIIVDGVHSHPAAVQIAFSQKGASNLYLITDAMRAKGMPEGQYELGGQKVIVKDNEAHLETGSLAGSVLKMNDGLRNLMSFTGESIDTLWRTTSFNQAKALGIDNEKGCIKEGMCADIVILNNNIEVNYTIKNGKVHEY